MFLLDLYSICGFLNLNAFISNEPPRVLQGQNLLQNALEIRENNNNGSTCDSDSVGGHSHGVIDHFL